MFGETGDPAANVEVEARRPSQEASVKVRTNESGVFGFEDLLAETRYVLQAVDRKKGLVSADAPAVLLKKSEQVEDLVLTLVAGASVSGRVTARENGTPMEGAHLSCQRSDDCLVMAAADSQSDGTYVLENVGPGQYVVSCAPPENRTVEDDPSTKEVTLEAGRCWRGLDFTFETGAAISGRVTAENGTLIAEACVSARSPVIRGTLTQPDGTYVLRGLAPDREYRMAVDASGYGLTGYPVFLPAGGRRDVNFILSHEASVSGRVVNERQEPLGKLSVRLMRDVDDPGEWYVGLQQMYTDSTSTFSFNNVAPGRYFFDIAFVTPDGAEFTGGFHVPGSDFSVSAGQHLTGMEIVIPTEGKFIAGRVMNELGEPVSEVKVNGIKAEGASDYVYTETDSSGAFRLEGFQSDVMDVSFQHPDHPYWRIRCPAGVSGIEVVLPNAGAVFGTVQDGATAMPIGGAKVRVDTETLYEGMQVAPLLNGTAIEGVTDESGKYVLSHLPPGNEIQVSAEAEGYLPETVSGLEVEGGACTENVDIQLWRCGRLEGNARVAFETDLPVLDFRVSARHMESESDRTSAEVDDAGYYGMDLRTGAHSVECTLNLKGNAGRIVLIREAEVRIEAGSTTHQDFVFEEVGAIRGSVALAAGEQNYIVSVVDAAEALPDDNRDALGLAASFYREEGTGSGTFELLGVQPGEYHLVAFLGAPGVQLEGMRRLVQPVTVGPGEVVDVALGP